MLSGTLPQLSEVLQMDYTNIIDQPRHVCCPPLVPLVLTWSCNANVAKKVMEVCLNDNPYACQYFHIETALLHNITSFRKCNYIIICITSCFAPSFQLLMVKFCSLLYIVLIFLQINAV